MRKFLLVLLFFCNKSFAQTDALQDIVQRMNKASANLHTARFTIYGEERLRNGKILISERIVKLNVKPQMVYFYSVRPDPGMEVLWRNSPGEKMLINPGGFPYITLNISHTSSIARKDAHHSIEDMGFDYAVRLVNYYMQTQGGKITKWATIKDTVEWQKKSCIHLIIDFREFRPGSYTVQKYENLSTIAAKLHVNDYMIFTMNPKVDDLEDVKAGQVITVPNYYASRIEFFIDRVTWLPVKQIIYDQKGVYEKYEINNLLVNPVIRPEEFTAKYKDYKF